MKRLAFNGIMGLALASLTLAPLSAFAQGRGNGHGRGEGKGWQKAAGATWNPAPPKKNGRHDNRDWNKNRRGDDDDWRYDQQRRSDPYYQQRRSDPYYQPRSAPQYDTRAYNGYGYTDPVARRQQT